MLDLRPVFFVVGILLTILGAFMLLPALVDAAFDGIDWGVFVLSSGLTAFVGVALALMNRSGHRTDLSTRQAFVLTVLAWVANACFGALPFMFSSLKLSFVDALFEAMSGLTTTGSTVILGLDRLAPGLLLWRSVLVWIGGMGFIVMGVAVLPMLRVGGMQLFRTESSDNSEKILPRAAQIAGAVGWTYLGLSVACAVLLWMAGMSAFDAVCHAMTTMGTGGFSTSDDSIGHWQSPAIEWIVIVFMTVGGMTFALLIRAIRGDPGALWRDSQIRAYLGLVLGVALVLAVWHARSNELPFFEAFRQALFNVVSVVTTTGYASADYGQWGPFAQAVFFTLIFVGGCTGSTAGGIKIFRLQVLLLRARVQVRHLLLPHGVFTPRYNGRQLPSDVGDAVTAFCYLFVLIFIVSALLLGLIGLDLVTALSGAATALANVGPGLGAVIGPSGTFATLPAAAKLVLTFDMLLGRLELFTVMVFVSKHFWRH
ncbi:MAG: TrkH family potassium uptake protein [Alphaproteobacteria bacterium]|nr:TrkH family potassium uptake protein [Alphaproteobacteria bacterium]